MEDFEGFIQTNGMTRGVTAPPSTDTATNLLESVMDDEEDMGDFMSPELRSFMEEAAATLKNEQLSLDEFRSDDSGPALEAETPDAATPRMVEDTEDMRLKQDVLDRLKERGGDYDEIMKSLEVQPQEERQQRDSPMSTQKSVSFASPSPKRVEAPKPQHISRPAVTPPEKKMDFNPRPLSSSSSKKKSTPTGKTSKSWSMEGLWKKTMSSPKAPKQPSPAASVPLPLSPAFQKPAAMTPLPPSPMDSSVKMASPRGGPTTPGLQDPTKISPVASFGGKNSSFRPRGGRKVVPLPPSPSPRKAPLKSPGLPAYMQPTDSFATRKAQTTSPLKQRVQASPLKQRVQASPLKQRAQASPLRRRVEASPQRQRRMEASPQRQRRVEANPQRQRGVAASPQRQRRTDRSPQRERMEEKTVVSSPRKGIGSPIKSPPPQIVSKTPPAASHLTRKPRPRVVTASPEKAKVLPPSAEQPKPAKSALRSGEDKKSFYDRLAQPRKQVVIKSPRKEKAANVTDPAAMTPPPVNQPKRMPQQRTPAAKKNESFGDGASRVDHASRGHSVVDVGEEAAEAGDDGGDGKPDFTMRTPEKVAMPKQQHVVELEGRKKVVAVKSKLAAYVGNRSSSVSSQKKKASLSPSTRGDNVTPRSAERQAFFDRRAASPRRLPTGTPPKIEKESSVMDPSVEGTPMKSPRASTTTQRPKPETTSFPGTERFDAPRESERSPSNRRVGPPKPESAVTPKGEGVNDNLVVLSVEGANGENHQHPSALKMALEEAAVPSVADADLIMSMAVEDDDEDDGVAFLPSGATRKVGESTDDNDFLPNSKPAQQSEPERGKRSTKERKVTSRVSHGKSSFSQRKKSGSKSATRQNQSSGRTNFMKGTASSATRQETAPVRKSTYADAKEAAKKARERVLQKKKLEAKKIAQQTKQNEEEAAKTGTKKYPKSGGSRKVVSAEDGLAKAKERVRRHQIAVKESEAKRAAIVTAPVIKRGAARSKEDAQAIAKERVRQRQLAALAKKAEMARRRMERANYLNSLPYSQIKSPTQTTRKHSSSAKTHWATGGTHSLDPNPITRALGSPTHGYSDRGAKPGLVGKPTLTVPKAPKLSTSKRFGEKKTPTVSAKKKPLPVAPVTPARSGGLTVPKAPKLSTTEKYGEKITPTAGHLHGDGSHEDDITKPAPLHLSKSKHSASEAGKVQQHVTLAEQMNDFMLHGLRDSKPVSTRRERTVTIPKSPKFTKIARRELPKSSAEREEEMMDYYKSHPFKAAPMPNISQVSRVQVQGMKSERTLTKPVGPHLQTKERVVYHKPPVGSPNKRRTDDEAELQRKFHARPMPDLSAPSQPVKPRGTAERKSTQPIPFQFAARPQKATKVLTEKAMDGTNKTFKARPLPLTTFTPPAISPLRHRSGPKSPLKTTEPAPPKFSTDARAEKRALSAEKHMRYAEKVQKKKERKRKQLQRLKHKAEMAEATEKPTVTTPQPFHLKSESRHAQVQRRLAEERARIQHEEEMAHEFKAMPYVPSPKPPAKKYRRPSSQLTKPAPFRLLSDVRHEKFEQKRKQELEEEKRRQMEARRVKANPVPMSTYMYKLPVRSSPKKLVEPESPELATSSRAEARREYDEKAEAERLAKQKMEQEMEEQRQKEEEEHLKELRRLPASEGGLMQVARPMVARPIGV